MSTRSMTQTRLKWSLLLLAVFTVMLSTPLMAGAPLPEIPKGKGDKCVEDTEYMRKNHMKVLFHQRDETVHLGIRTKKHSLKNCIDCHAVEVNGQPVSIASPKHFCRVCHDYASVNIDCFECHASKPRMKPVNSTKVNTKDAMPSAMLPQDINNSIAQNKNGSDKGEL